VDAIHKNSDTITVAAFVYDALGRRIETVNNGYGIFYYDQPVLLEVDVDGSEKEVQYFIGYI
jgi:YD repeat-containing protein